ncbi:MAG: RNase J family beta-CASP ribonuclease [Candidatus Woesearchaeota archaeon]
MIKVCTIGGYNEIGRNCTAIKIDNEVVILDLGLHLERYIRYTEDEDIKKISSEELVKVGALPDLSIIDEWIKDVVALVPTHAHLDHVGGIPYLSDIFNAPIISTPFTNAVIKAILNDEKMHLKNPLKVVNINSKYRISENIEIEFVNITHSTPHTAMVVLHTKYGAIIYANDFKIDNFPTLGLKPNFDKLKEIGKKGVICLIIDSLYADTAGKTPSEEVAKTMLKDVLLSTNSDEKAIVVTTFSSHIARIKSIVEIAKQMNRKILFLGRSLSKYVNAAEECGIINFSDEVEIVKYSSQVKKRIKQLNNEKEKYIVVCTGHQGEKQAVLSKIARDEINFKIGKDDIIIFSCTVIPTNLNISNREELETELEKKGIRIFKDIHVSGHGSKEDMRDIINILNPKYIIPAHSDLRREALMAKIASDMGYELGEKVFIMQNKQFLELK